MAMPEQAEPEAEIEGGITLDPGLQSYIGQQLRTVYEEVLNEQVPDRFLMLLQELERKQEQKK